MEWNEKTKPFFSRYIYIFCIYVNLTMILTQKFFYCVANNVPDPRVNGKECGLAFETTQFFLCDPYHFLDPGEQLKLITNLNTLYMTRIHQCNDHVSEPLLVSIFLSSDHQNGQDTFEMQYPEQFLESVLDKVSYAPKEDASKDATHAPLLSSCGKHFSILYNPLNAKPIISIRCDNALEPIFTEPEYPELLQHLLSVCNAETSIRKSVPTIDKSDNLQSGQSNLFKTLSLILEKIEENFPLTGDTDTESAKVSPIKFEKATNSLASVIKNLQGTYDKSIEDLESDAEREIENMLQGRFSVKESIFGFFKSHGKQLIIIGTGCLLWTCCLEILHQILLKRFSNVKITTQVPSIGYNTPRHHNQTGQSSQTSYLLAV